MSVRENSRMDEGLGNGASVASAATAVGDDFQALRRDVAKLSETVAGLVKQQADTAAANVSNTISSAKDSLSDSAGRASRQVSSLAGQVEPTIERNPLAAVLVAFSVGLMAGILGGTRR